MKLFTGERNEIYNKVAFYKNGKEYIPCLVTNYYFSLKKYILVPLEDLAKYSIAEHEKRRVFSTKNIYVLSEALAI